MTALRDQHRPGTVYWIDHHVVASPDIDRWTAFMTKVIGAKSPDQYNATPRANERGETRWPLSCTWGRMKAWSR